MRCRLLIIFACLLLPLTASAVYFPAGIDWTNPSQNRFVQSLYLNMLGRAPDSTETQNAVSKLRRNDNRTSRLRMFESVTQSSEYQRYFNNSDTSWKIFQAPDYNYNNGSGYYRYLAAPSKPQGFSDISSAGRSFSKSIAKSVARYYDAFCYRGDPCIDNPELAHDKNASLLTESSNNPPINNSSINNGHACADPASLNSQFKWVAINGTTYPRGIGQDTICLEDSYFKVNRLNLERYSCDAGYTNCRRNRTLDLRASRSGPDNDGHPSYFFRDGSRLSLIRSDQNTNNTVITTSPQTDPLLADDAHACADPSQTNSRFTWQTPTRTAEAKGIGSNVICMDDYYYSVQRMTLQRHNCQRGFVNCQPDPTNNLTAESRTRVNGNPGMVFPNGTTVTLTARNLAAPATTSSPNRVPANNQTQPRPNSGTQARPTTQQQAYNGVDCADSKNRLSQFRWKSHGLSSWPDGIDGRIICLNNSYYELTPTSLRNYSCQSNYTNCTANPSKNHAIRQVSKDGTLWTLSNGDEVTLISK